jgi:hypothetical protein
MRAQVSPDGKWLAYMSSETGRQEVYVTTFPVAGQKWRVSTEGGGFPRWSPHDDELFFTAHRTLMSASIRPNGVSLEVTGVRPLFDVRFNPFLVSGYSGHPYDVAPDGRILAIVAADTAEAAPIRLVINWPSLVRR